MSWKNESRLYNYPYSFAMISDHLNPPMEVKYHLVPSNIATLKVRNTISDRCSYGLFIEGYKGDSEGKMEALVSGDAHELPCSSSAYNQWFASNKNQTNQQVQHVMQNSFLTKQTNSRGLVTGMIGTMASTSLNPMSIIGAGANMVANRYKGIRAICASDPVEAFFARKDEDANVLTIGSRFVSFRKAIKIIQIFLTSEFEGGRHARRIAKY